MAEIDDVRNAFIAAFNARDWDAARAVVADDMVLDDRRPAQVLPPVTGGDEFVARLKEGIEAMPDRSLQTGTLLVGADDRAVNRSVFRGHDAVGGGEIVSDRLIVTRVRDGRYVQMAFFEVEQEAEARAYYDQMP